MTKLAIVTSHPIQYYAPLFRELARRADLHVFYMHRVTEQDHASAGFGIGFQWDVDLLSGYSNSFLDNISQKPSLHSFSGVDVPSIHKALLQGEFGAVLVTGWHLKGYLQAVCAAKRLGLSVLVRGDSQLETPRHALKRYVKSLVYPLLLRSFDAALYVGTRSRAYYTHYQFPQNRLFFSPHCIDNDWFAARANSAARRKRRAGIASGAKVVLFAGKLQPFKRPLDVIDACAQLRSSGVDVQVMVAGSGELEGAMRQRALAADVPLHILGFQNQSAMPEAYAAADILVLSSSSETWGLVANEALACGKPIVVSDACGCAPDLAADGQAGAVFPVGNIYELAASLDRLFKAPPSVKAISARITEYSLYNAAQGIIEATERIVDMRYVAK